MDVSIERASADDLAMLVLEGRGAVPVQIGVALALDVGPGLDSRHPVAVLSDRIRGVPRLRLLRVLTVPTEQPATSATSRSDRSS